MQKDNLEIKIRKGEKADAKAIEKIEKACFSHPWTAENIIDSFDNYTVFFVSLAENRISGYCGMQEIAGEGYITNVAVLPEMRGGGIATALLKALLDYAKEKGLEFVTLEVRKSNIPAINLYKKLDFRQVGERPNFYRDPTEDALLLTKFL